MSWIVLILLIVLIAVLALRLKNLKEMLDGFMKDSERNLGRLTERVWALEHQAPPAAPSPRPVPERARSAVEPSAPAPAPVTPAPVPAPAEPRPREWEALIGGNLLNKVGVLVTVIGIALFLGYSFSHLSPGGRIGLATIMSVCLLVAGIVLERRPRYTIFARGLIGGGWAAIYFTTYAAHGVDAARVIHNPVIATCLLALISIACILHSLRYRSEVVTGLGYFVAFITLAITPLTTFAMLALVPLAASLLYLSFRFSWTAMALPGLAATYGLYFAHAAGSPEANLLAGQTILLVYWLLFEGFDLIGTRKGGGASPLPAALFTANAVGFLGLSWLQWHATQPDTLYLSSIVAAVAYLGSVLARVFLTGRYQNALAVAAGVGAVAIFQGLDGLAVTYALIAEAELLFLVGLLVRQLFVRRLSEALFALALGKLVFADILNDASLSLAGIIWYGWTPVALLQAALLYGNRWLAPLRHVYGYAAAAIVVLVLGFELPPEYIGVSWLLFAAVLFELGIFSRLADFRYQAYAVGVASLVPLAVSNALGFGIAAPELPWQPQAIAVLLLFLASARLESLCRGDTGNSVLARARDVAVLAGTAKLAILLWNVLPASLVAVGWAALGLALVSSAHLFSRRGPRLLSYALTVLTFDRCWSNIVDSPDPLPAAATRILVAAAVVAGFYAAAMLCPRPETLQPATGWRLQIDALGRPGYSVLASALLVLLLSYEVSGSLLTVAWGCQGVALLTAGFLLRERSLRLPGLFLLVGCILKLFLYDLRNLETPARIASFLVLGAILIGVSWIYTRFRERLSRLF